jgi:hypothetical protein
MSDANETTNEDPWLTTGEAAAILGASVSSVRRMAANGTLDCERIHLWASKGVDRLGRSLPGHRRISRESVMEVKREHDRAAAALRAKSTPDTLDT